MAFGSSLEFGRYVALSILASCERPPLFSFCVSQCCHRGDSCQTPFSEQSGSRTRGSWADCCRGSCTRGYRGVYSPYDFSDHGSPTGGIMSSNQSFFRVCRLGGIHEAQLSSKVARTSSDPLQTPGMLARVACLLPFGPSGLRSSRRRLLGKRLPCSLFCTMRPAWMERHRP